MFRVLGTAVFCFASFNAFALPSYKLIDLGTLAPEGASEAGRINESGQVIGRWRFDPYGENFSFLYANGQLQNLGQVTAIDISESGEILLDTGETVSGRPAIFDDPLVNDFGHRVFDQSGRAYVNTEGVITDLGSLGPVNIPESAIDDGFELIDQHKTGAYAINNNDEVVGYSYGNQIGLSDGSLVPKAHAILWTTELGLIDLNTVTYNLGEWDFLERAFDINDLGQIIGIGQYNGNWRAFLLNPEVQTLPTPIPPTALMLLSGLVLIGRKLYRKT